MCVYYIFMTVKSASSWTEVGPCMKWLGLVIYTSIPQHLQEICSSTHRYWKLHIWKVYISSGPAPITTSVFVYSYAKQLYEILQLGAIVSAHLSWCKSLGAGSEVTQMCYKASLQTLGVEWKEVAGSCTSLPHCLGPPGAGKLHQPIST